MSETTEQEAAEVFRHADELQDEAIEKWGGDLKLASKDLAFRLAMILQYVGKLARPVEKQ